MSVCQFRHLRYYRRLHFTKKNSRVASETQDREDYEDEYKRFALSEISFQRERLENHTKTRNDHICPAHDINHVAVQLLTQKTNKTLARKKRQ